jgi:hypothetical protein
MWHHLPRLRHIWSGTNRRRYCYPRPANTSQYADLSGLTGPRNHSFTGFSFSAGSSIGSSGSRQSGTWSSRWRISVSRPAHWSLKIHHHPGRARAVGSLEHDIARLAVGAVFFARDKIDRGQLPAHQRVVGAFSEACFLLALVHGQPVLEQQNAAFDQRLLEIRGFTQEGFVLGVRAEALHLLHAGPVVPTAIEQHPFACRRQVRVVALPKPDEWYFQRYIAHLMRVEPAGDRGPPAGPRCACRSSPASEPGCSTPTTSVRGGVRSPLIS